MDDDLDEEAFLEEFGDQYQQVENEEPVAAEESKPAQQDNFDPDKFLEQHNKDGFDPDEFLKTNEQKPPQISVLESMAGGAAKGSTLGMAPKIMTYLKSLREPGLDPVKDLAEKKKWYEESAKQNPISHYGMEALGSAIPYGIMTVAGGLPGTMSAAAIDASNRVPDPTPQELKTESPISYGAKKTIGVGSEAMMTGLMDKGFRAVGRGAKALIPDAETAALSGLGATMSTRQKLNRDLPINGEKSADAIADYVMNTKGTGFSPPSVLAHVEAQGEKIGHEIGSYVDKTNYLMDALPKGSKYHFMTSGKDLAKEFRKVGENAQGLMDPAKAGVAEEYAKMAEKMGNLSPNEVFEIRVNLDKMMRDKAAWTTMATGRKDGLQEVRHIINSNLVDGVTASEIFDNLADKRAVEMAMNGTINDKQFLSAMNGAIGKYNSLKGMPRNQLPDDMQKAVAAIDRPVELRKQLRLLKEVGKVAQYGTDRQKGNNLFGLRTAMIGTGLGAGGVASNMPIEKVAMLIALGIPIQVIQRYGPIAHAKAVGGLRKLPNPLDNATGNMIKTGAQTYPAVKLPPEIIDYLNSMSQGGEK